MNDHTSGKLLLLAAAALCWLAAAVPAAAVTITDPGQGSQTFSGMSAAELSGITYAGGTTYHAVSDSTGSLYSLSVALDGTTGVINSITVDSSLALPGTSDLEGIAYDAGTGTVYVSDEIGPAITRRSLVDGSVQQTVGTGMYGSIVGNFSLESLSLAPGGAALWTANEQAMTNDGPQPDNTTGNAVRLQRFDSSGNPTGQWAYITDPTPGASATELSGVVDVAALPGGKLLVLERAVSLFSGFRSRIYEVDFSGATDTTSIPMLDTNTNNDLSDEAWMPVGKSLLWEMGFLTTNYEGMTLGPALAGGEYSLLLVSDDQTNTLPQALYPLRISNIPEPSTWVLLAVGGAMLIVRARRRGSPT